LPLILQLLVSGLAVGSIYALVALSYNAIFRTSQVVNFAQGELLMIGGLLTVGLYTWFGMSIWLAFPLGVCLAVVVGLLIERLAVRPVQRTGAGAHGWIVTTLGAGIIIRAAAFLAWGTRDAPMPKYLGGGRVLHVAGAAVSEDELLVIVAVLAILVLLELVNRYTILGKALRATACDQEMARLVGIPAPRMIAASFALGAGLAAIGGILLTNVAVSSPYMGIDIGLKGFAAAALGGLGSPLGGVLGGLIIGVAEVLGAFYISSSIKDSIALVLLFALLMLRPAGLLGRDVMEKV
jgi:branched-chain amino acid transport system permease protein